MPPSCTGDAKNTEKQLEDHRKIYVDIHTDSAMILYVLLAFILTLMLVPGISQFMKRHSITGKDVHKSLQPEIPEMGGLSYVSSLAVVLLMAFILLHSLLYVGALSVLMLTALIGAYDDLRGLHQFHKVVLTCGAGIPLLFFVEDTTIDFILISLDLSFHGFSLHIRISHQPWSCSWLYER